MNLNSPFVPFARGYTSALNANPDGYLTGRGIGLATPRINGVGDILSDVVDLANQWGAGTYLRGVMNETRMNLLRSQGWTFLEAVTITYNGQQVSGVKAKDQAGNFYVFVAGVNDPIPFTPAVAATAVTVNPTTGMPMSTLAIGGVALAVGAIALYFILRRK